MDDLRITKLQRAPEGHWTARVTRAGATTPVDRLHGSWRQTPAPGDGWREVPPAVAARLQEKVRPLERAETRKAA